MKLTHPWEPEYSKDSKLLILGTFPSPKSREMGYYYGHPQNAFWKTLAKSLGAPEPPYDAQARQRFVREHGVALWDVFRAVDIDGAADASIRDEVPNTFRKIIDGSNISAVFTNGRTGTDAFNRLCSTEAGMRSVYLPSTSPANRRTQGTEDYELRWSLIGKLLRGELVSSAGMKELDRRTIEEKGVPSLVLMERAALAVTAALDVTAAAATVGKAKSAGKVLCVCGAGNNGGDGFAIARLLKLAGRDVEVLFIGDRKRMSEETKQQARIAENYGVPITENDLSVINQITNGKSTDNKTTINKTTANKTTINTTTNNKTTTHKTNISKTDINKPAIIIDALFGIGLVREVLGKYLDAINAINKAKKAGAFVLSVDVPSGISADTGEALGGAVAADETVTFAYNKIGLTIGNGVDCVGKLSVADIGIY